MSKRAADADDEQSAALKAGERPMVDAPADEVGEFEDEFEDEFESEDEILEAGVDGRPDAEREEEERGWSSLFQWALFCRQWTI
jgi:ribosome assembly protein RRB1